MQQSAKAVGSIILRSGSMFFFLSLLRCALTNVGFIAAGWAEPPVIAYSGWLETIKAYIWEIKPHSWIAFNLIDGLVRMLFFVIMIFSMSYLKDIRRVFECPWG